MTAYKSAILSTDLKYSYLKQRTADPIVDRIFAKPYWWTGVLAYPNFKNISRDCIQKAKQLGYSGPKYIGGPKGQFLNKYFGWKAARYFSHFQQLLINH